LAESRTTLEPRLSGLSFEIKVRLPVSSLSSAEQLVAVTHRRVALSQQFGGEWL